MIENICPVCKGEMIVIEKMFHYKGTFFSGLLCLKCNSLYDNPNDSFEKAVGIKFKQ